MKIDRLIGILAILLQKKKVTAPYLAEKFEVSRRTINRDIEAICKAGIPLITSRGQHGGISIMDGYCMAHTLLTSSDRKAILTGLKSLDSVCKTNRYAQLMEKLSIDSSFAPPSSDSIRIDLASWYKAALSTKIEFLQDAMEQKEKICFQYYAPKGESIRIIEPYQLIFQWSSWYIWGYCCEKQDYRLFKLNRMTDLKHMGEHYEKRSLPASIHAVSAKKEWSSFSIEITAAFNPSMKWRLIEEYGIQSFTKQPNGTLLFSGKFSDKNALFGWLLSFGDQVELIAPKPLRSDFQDLVKKIQRLYET